MDSVRTADVVNLHYANNNTIDNGKKTISTVPAMGEAANALRYIDDEEFGNGQDIDAIISLGGSSPDISSTVINNKNSSSSHNNNIDSAANSNSKNFASLYSLADTTETSEQGDLDSLLLIATRSDPAGSQRKKYNSSSNVRARTGVLTESGAFQANLVGTRYSVGSLIEHAQPRVTQESHSINSLLNYPSESEFVNHWQVPNSSLTSSMEFDSVRQELDAEETFFQERISVQQHQKSMPPFIRRIGRKTLSDTNLDSFTSSSKNNNQNITSQTRKKSLFEKVVDYEDGQSHSVDVDSILNQGEEEENTAANSNSRQALMKPAKLAKSESEMLTLKREKERREQEKSFRFMRSKGNFSTSGYFNEERRQVSQSNIASIFDLLQPRPDGSSSRKSFTIVKELDKHVQLLDVVSDVMAKTSEDMDSFIAQAELIDRKADHLNSSQDIDEMMQIGEQQMGDDRHAENDFITFNQGVRDTTSGDEQNKENSSSNLNKNFNTSNTYGATGNLKPVLKVNEVEEGSDNQADFDDFLNFGNEKMVKEESIESFETANQSFPILGAPNGGLQLGKEMERGIEDESFLSISNNTTGNNINEEASSSQLSLKEQQDQLSSNSISTSCQ